MGDANSARHRPGPIRSRGARHLRAQARPGPRWCKVHQGPMPVPETLAKEINSKYLNQRETSATSDPNASSWKYQNWTLFLTPDNPKVVVSDLPKKDPILTAFPHMEPYQTGETQPKIVVHWLDRSRAQRILWLLEELNLEYELKIYHRVENNLAPAELRGIHPLGKSPVVVVDDVVLAESGFIVQYLTNRWNHLQPALNTPSAFQYQYLLHYVEGSLMPPLFLGEVLQQIKNSPRIPFFVRPISNMIVNSVYTNYLNAAYESNFRFLETMLDDQEYFCGPFSGADVLLGFPLLEAAKARVEGFNEAMFPNLFNWMQRITAREGFKKAEARTQRYELPRRS